MDTNEPKRDVSSLSRREMLTYLWLGSGALLAAQGIGIGLWYSLPELIPKEPKMGDIFEVALPIPAPGSNPILIRETKTWLVHLENGSLNVFYIVCPHTVPCIYRWVEANMRFECPCCGSKFEPNGSYIEGPSQRNLDRFPMTLFTSEGNFKTNTAGDPIFLPANAVVEKIHINTGKLILGAKRRYQ